MHTNFHCQCGNRILRLVGVICGFEIESAVRFTRFVGRCCMRKMKSGPWPIHDNTDTDKSNESSYQIELVWRYPVYLPTPQHSHNNENPAICSINSSEVCWLECWVYRFKGKRTDLRYRIETVLGYNRDCERRLNWLI